MIDPPNAVLISAFMGSFLGIPAGFLAVEVIKFIQSKREEKPGDDILDWAMSQQGAEVIEQTQVANRYIRTYDFTGLEQVDRDGEVVGHVEVPHKFATTIVTVGSSEYHRPVPADSIGVAKRNHLAAVNQVRKILGLIP